MYAVMVLGGGILLAVGLAILTYRLNLLRQE